MNQESRLAMTVDTDLDLSQRKTIARALDMLGSALADHGHEWSDEECGAYEAAHRELQGVEMTPREAVQAVSDGIKEFGVSGS
ncbi:hypothetical protein A8U91_01336 [Halomonas elongata]|uniref:Uncharacterized protein n=1 Tax=Halomonas elongata TaxID=2746 RepID=A0A1B8P423_HALEL|nr:hypothetical protein [Halomonas elongata]OBX36988.1 hypothetical protein A8U91_01336 [Halomonas elongata]